MTIKNVLIFLDFDGVLHPDAVYLRLNCQIELRAEGELFMWSSHLVEALAPHQDVQIVLSTSWARNLGFQRARAALPAALRTRVIGATWHSSMSKGLTDYVVWDNQTRYEQIKAYLSRLSAPARWLAVDDDGQGWAEADRQRLIQTDQNRGLSCSETRAELARKLEEL